MKLKVKGMRTATKKLADGQIAYYAYAYQGGPLVAKGIGTTKRKARNALERALIEPEALAKITAAQEARSLHAAPSVAFADGVVLAYLKSREWQKLAERTKKDWRHHLSDFRDEFGDWRTSIFEDPRIAQDMADWRDAHPSVRQGQMRMEVVSRLFSWARARGFTRANPTEPLERIYKVDRSDVIWTDDELSAVLEKSNPALQFAIRLAVETGLRQGDLIRLPWSAVSDLSIQYTTAKRKKPVIIPVTPALRDLLAEIPKASPIVLLSSTGRAWTSDGLRTSFAKAKKRAGIDGKRWHDFRGTAVTRLAKTNLRLDDIARIIGWSRVRVEEIMTRYVSADEVAKDMLLRISGEQVLQTELQTEQNEGEE